EFPHQCDVRRHRVRAVGKHGTQNGGTDTITLRHRDAELRTWAAVLVAHRSQAGGEPCLDGHVTPELSESGGTEKEPHRTWTRPNHVPDIGGRGVQVPL